MKKGFTLVELLIVVAVMVILMGLVVRLGSSGTDSSRRSRTLARMQRVENCLSGYFAAYGTYPQVKNHGAPDYTFKVNGHGIQLDSQNANIWGWSAIGEKTATMLEFQTRDADSGQLVDTSKRHPYLRAIHCVISMSSSAGQSI